MKWTTAILDIGVMLAGMKKMDDGNFGYRSDVEMDDGNFGCRSDVGMKRI